MIADIYCLDANALIQAWQKYYAPRICPDYWEVLNELGIKRKSFFQNWFMKKSRERKMTWQIG